MTAPEKILTCSLCPHRCRLAPGQTGFCRARTNREGTICPDNYGFLTALALDPIEKKPLRRFHPGSQILSLGSWGCNLRCPFCQNASISQAGAETARLQLNPEQLLALGFQVLPSRTNFLFASPPDGGGAAYQQALRRQNILVRHFPGQRTAPFVRISIGTQAQMEQLMKVTKEMYSDA